MLLPNSILAEDYLLLPHFSTPSLPFHPSAQTLLSLLEDEGARSAVQRVRVPFAPFYCSQEGILGFQTREHKQQELS